MPSAVGNCTCRSSTSRYASSFSPRGRAVQVTVSGARVVWSLMLPPSCCVPWCQGRPGSSEPYPGVEEGVGDVDDQVHHDEHGGADQHTAQEYRKVVLAEGAQREQADARQTEDALGEDRAGELERQVDAEDGGHWREGRPQAVAVDHAALGDALGPGGPDEVLAEGFDHGGARVAGVRRRVRDADREPGGQQTA